MSYQVKQIEEKAWIVQEPEVRCFLFVGTQRALLVDSGWHIADLRQEVSALTNLPVQLINTHADIDHVQGNKQFPVPMMHPAEFCQYRYARKNTDPVIPVWEGTRIDLGNRIFEVVAIPGHTPGSIALLDRKNHLLVGGDSVQNGTIYMYGPYKDFTAYMYSLRKLNKMIDLFQNVYASHADLEVSAAIIPKLIAGGEKLMQEGFSGEKVVIDGIPVLNCLFGPAHILVPDMENK